MNFVAYDLSVAKAYLRHGNIPDAEAIYGEILDDNPDCAEAIHFLGVAAMQKGHLDEAHRLRGSYSSAARGTAGGGGTSASGARWREAAA